MTGETTYERQVKRQVNDRNKRQVNDRNERQVNEISKNNLFE